MRAQHPQGDAKIAALWRAPEKLADDPDDMAFSPHDLATIRARTLLAWLGARR